MLPDKDSKAKPLLQGWAIVDNTIGEDWTRRRALAGCRRAAVVHQDISQPFYGRRSVVPMPSTVLLAPQTHQAAMGDGAGTVSGVVPGFRAAPSYQVRRFDSSVRQGPSLPA